MGPTPCYSQCQVVSVCQSFRHVAPFFSLAKVPFYAYDIPLVILSQSDFCIKAEPSVRPRLL